MNIGIDFGTTNSSLAYQPGPGVAPVCAAVDQHVNIPFDAVLRSAVLMNGSGRVAQRDVGGAALNPLSWIDPKTRERLKLVINFKPLLGTFRLREQSILRSMIDGEHYDHLRQQPSTVTITETVVSGDSPYTRHEVINAAAAVLGRLLESVPQSVMSTSPVIVIGVPLTFPDYAKKRLLEIIVRTGALKSAEPFREALRRIRFVPEPVGASFLYGEEWDGGRSDSERVLIFDSGGGTLDLALIEYERRDDRMRPVRQLALGGRVLAGRRFDQCIEQGALETVRDKVERASAEFPDGKEIAAWRLSQAAESIKIALSTRESHEELSLMPAGVRSVTLTRSQFESWARPILDDTERLIRETVRDLGDVDTVAMVGGSSLVPCVQSLVKRLFPTASVMHENPARRGRGEGVERSLTAVSRGLALYDDATGQSGVTPFEYGFYSSATCQSITSVQKWAAHSTEGAIARIPVAPGADRVTVTLMQDLVEPERVLNLINAPVPEASGKLGYLPLRVRTSDAALYPDIEMVAEETGEVISAFRSTQMSESLLRTLVTHDHHVVPWPGSASNGRPDTTYPELVSLAKGDPVIYRQWRPDGAFTEARGTITEIQRVSDCAVYRRVEHWDIRRWRFRVERELSYVYLVPQRIDDIRLDRAARPRR